jgi:HEAT repeats
VAETRGGNERPDTERAAAAPELLRAAIEKVVFFEWRLGEMAGELAAAQARAEAAEIERARLAEQRADAERETQAARRRAHELEAERQRLSSLVLRPAQAAAEHAAVQTERLRSAELAASLAEARREIERQRAERDRWLDERLSQALGSADSEGSLAGFISELRGEVIALRERQKQCDEALRQAGIEALPPPSSPAPPLAAAPRLDDTIEAARALWSQGRLGVDAPQALAPAAATAPIAPVSAARVRLGAAASALADQCLRGLSARDPARREQAARHLAAMPVPSAAPALASALGAETDPRTRGQIALALVACGGTAAADLVASLQFDPEPLVRLAALDALCSVADRAADALRTAERDDSSAVRRRAAAIAAALGLEEIRGRFALDADGSVRAASAVRELPEPPQPAAPRAPEVLARSGAAPVRPVPAAAGHSRDLAGDAVLAVQTAIFGLTEAELADALSVPVPEMPALVASLVSAGRLARRGKRLVAAAQGGP